MSNPEADQNQQRALLSSLKMVRSADPKERRNGVLALESMIDDPRVAQVCEHLYRSDPDSSVREAAWSVMGHQNSSIPKPGPQHQPRKEPRTRINVQTASVSGPRQPFLLNPGNAGLAAKEIKRTRTRSRSTRGWWWIVAVLLLAVGLSWGIIAQDVITWIRLELDGATVSGTMVALETQGPTDDPSYLARYRFSPDPDAAEPATYSGEQPLTEKAFALLDGVETVEVTYVDSDPTISRIDARNPDNVTRDRIAVIASGLTILLALALIMALAAWRANRKDPVQRLRRGQIVACSGAVTTSGAYEIALRYRFKSLKGQMVTVDSRMVRNDLRDRPLPQPGTPVLVLYGADKTYRAL